MGSKARVIGLSLFGTALVAQAPAPAPVENPTTAAKVLLGKMLFWEEQLSSDDSVACGTCHRPESGGSDPRAATAIHPGADGLFGTEDDVFGSPGVVRQDAVDFLTSNSFASRVQVTGRLAPTNLGVADHADLFWDGRATTTFVDPLTGAVVIPFGGALESQALGPILSPVEMAAQGRTWDDVTQKLQNVRPMHLARNLPPDVAAAVAAGNNYPDLFAVAFGDHDITPVRIAFALAAYQRTLNPDQTPFDRYAAGDTAALTPDQVTGQTLFFGQANCVFCHRDPTFSDDAYHSLGLRPANEDVGRMAITGVPEDLGAFKTPSLRNAGLRPRLFHNGQSPALGDPEQISDVRSVANVYLRGGGADVFNRDPALVPLGVVGLNLQDMQKILDFVRHGLTDPRAAAALPPFDHPSLRTEVVSAPLRYGPALAGSSVPDFVTTAPTFPGNENWKLGLLGGNGDTAAYLAYSLAPRTPGYNIAGVPIHIGEDLEWVPLLLHGPGGVPGIASWHVAIPPAQDLLGLTGYFQLFTIDSAAPIGIAASSGLRLTIE